MNYLQWGSCKQSGYEFVILWSKDVFKSIPSHDLLKKKKIESMWLDMDYILKRISVYDFKK